MNYAMTFLLLLLFQSPDILVTRLMGNMRVREACEFIEKDQIALPPGTTFAQALKQQGLTDVHEDAAGNVIGIRPGQAGQPLIAVAVHLNESRSTASMLAIIRAMDKSELRTKSSIAFVGTPTKHGEPFLEDPLCETVRAFIFVDALPADRIAMAPKTIGSTVVQLAMQMVAANGVKPEIEENVSDMVSPLEMKIPSVGIGLGNEGAGGVKLAFTTILAIAGLV